jgi:hypothetical protein
MDEKNEKVIAGERNRTSNLLITNPFIRQDPPESPSESLRKGANPNEFQTRTRDKHATPNHGYKAIRVDGKKRDEHRVVMDRKLGRRLKSTELVHHKNENKRDNAEKNLELTDRSTHARRHMRGRKASDSTKAILSLALRGTNNANAKLTEQDVLAIAAALDSGVSIPDLSDRFQISRSAIRDIKTRRKWKHLLTAEVGK